MANCTTKFRTNYFRVKDPDAFENLMDAAGITLENRMLWRSCDSEDRLCYAFGNENGDLDETVDPDFQLKLAYPDFPQRRDHDIHMTWRGQYEDFLRKHGLEEPTCEDLSDKFIAELQKHICEDDCIVIQMIGSEALYSLYAGATIVKTDSVDYIDMQNYLEQAVAAAMGEEFSTRYEG